MYIKSENIKIYPSSLRGAVDPEANLTAESSLTKFVSRCHRKSFVLDYSDDSLTFFVEGYFFKIDNVSTNLSSLSGNIYAHIRLDDMEVVLYPTTTELTAKAKLRTLVNIDGSSILDDSTSSEFRGMIISTNTTEPNVTSSLHILTKDTDGSFKVPDDSWVQLDGKAILVGGKLLSSLFSEYGDAKKAEHAYSADYLGGNPSSYYTSLIASSVTTLQSNLESGNVVVKKATNADYATEAGKADKADTADTLNNKSESQLSVSHATTAGNASKLNNKRESELRVSHANTANTATTAGHATTAESATYLNGSDSSYYATAESVTTLERKLKSGDTVVGNSTKLNDKEASYYATATSVNDTNAGLTETINRVSALENSKPSVNITVNDDGTANITFTNLIY